MTTSEYEVLPKLLPQVIKAIVDLHELNGSSIEDIVDQVQTNMAFCGMKPTKKNIKLQVNLCLRHGVRLGCFRVESQGKFRLNKLRYCVPVLKCVLSHRCVNHALKSRYLTRHRRFFSKEGPVKKKSVQSRRLRNDKTSRRISNISDCADNDKSILPYFREPLTSYKKPSNNSSVICIYDPAGHLGPQMDNHCMNRRMVVDKRVGDDTTLKPTNSGQVLQKNSDTNIEKLLQNEGVLRSLQRKFNKIQRCLWGCGKNIAKEPSKIDEVAKKR